VAVDELVEAREEAIEESYDLARVEAAGERSEVDDVREQDAHVVEMVGDRIGIGLQPLRDLGREDVEQQRLYTCLRGVPSSRESHQQQHRHERDHDDVEDVERPDEAVRQIGAIGANDFGEADCEQDRGDEGREPGPGPAGTVQRDRPERREQRPEDHRTGLAKAAEHHGPQRGCHQDQQQLRCPQRSEVPGPREDGEAERRAGDISPRRERDGLLAERPVQAAPEEPDREDEDRHPDEEALPEALVGRVARIRPDRQGPFAKRRGHDRRA
jgi:hypothetical protein